MECGNNTYMVITDEKQKKLYFIVGVGRSGTSFLQEIMCTFSGFCNKKESKIGGSHSMTCWTPVRKNKDFSYLEKFIEENWTGEYFVEKTPDSILCIPEMLEKYPKANYIFLYRNPHDIILSQLNMFNIPSDDFLERRYHIENLIMNEEDFFLTSELYWTKFTNKQISQLISNKKESTNAITIKYETLVKSLKSQLDILEKKFQIQPNYDEANKVVGRPSYSSKINSHKIKKMTEKTAISLMNQTCEILGYTPKTF